MDSIANTVQIPVIDISDANADAPQQLLDAAVHYGFVFVANNEAGISPDLIKKLFQISQEFFALPREVKEAVSINSNKAGKNHGWLSQGVEKLDPQGQKRPDVKEAFNLSLPTPNGTFDQPLPQLFQTHISDLITFETACYHFCQRLLTHFATALEIPSDWFTSRHDISSGKPAGSVFRLLYYPQRRRRSTTKTTTTTELRNADDDDDVDDEEGDDEDIRAGAHSDYGSLTCLFQQPGGPPGLEIKSPDDNGEWAAVPVNPLIHHDNENNVENSNSSPLPILVNIGDLLEDWTGGLLKSTVHRVVFPQNTKKNEKKKESDRYSLAYFCHPLDEVLLEPVPSRKIPVEGGMNKKKKKRTVGGQEETMTARDHLMERLAATYKV